MAAHPTWLAATCIVVVALIIHIVGVATPVWVTNTTFDTEVGEETTGLWKTCGNNPEIGHWCEDLPSDFVKPWFAATRAMAVIGILAIFATVACGGFISAVGFISAKPQNIALTWITFAFVGIAVASTAIAVIVFGTKSGLPGEHQISQLGYSFYLCMASAILSAVSSVLFGVGQQHIIHGSYISLK